jgi:hypothetical protein
MRIRRHTVILGVFIAVSLLVLFVGCKNDVKDDEVSDTSGKNQNNNNTDGDNSGVTGDYVNLTFWVLEGKGEATFTAISLVNGTCTANEILDSDGTPEGVTTGKVTFSTMADGSLLVTPEGEDPLRGVISGNEEYMTLTRVSSSEGLGIEFFQKKSTDMGVASLCGSYLAFGYRNSGANSVVGYTRLTFDGLGTVTRQRLYSSAEGVISEPSTDLQYIVSEDGIFSISSGGTEVVRGIIGADGEIGSHVATNGQDNGFIGITFMVRESSGMSCANLSGNYIMTAFETQKTALTPHTYVYSVSSNGAGEIYSTCLYESGDGSHVGEVSSGMYSISDTGGFSLGEDGSTISGVVSQDGSFFTFILPATDNNEVQLYVGIKKP